MIFSEDSYTAAQHAAEKSFLNHEMLPLIKAERDVDEAIEEE
jgi:hypothetical protein